MEKGSIGTIVYVVLLVLVFRTTAPAQQPGVENVTFEEIGDSVIVHYDLHGPDQKRFRVRLLVSEDSGATFSILPRAISGDVGRNTLTGIGKRIVWQMKKDFPGGLYGEDFVFAVDAVIQRRSKWPYIAAGAGILGGTVLLLTSGKRDTDPTTGSIRVSVTREF